jgi:acyl-CoA thioesterase-1
MGVWRIALLLVVISACGRDKFDSIRNLESAGQAVICFGDSLTEGVGAAAGEDYPSQLARRLDLPVINAGRRGDTTADALNRLPQDVLARNPRLVIVLLGGNDFLRQVPVPETRRNVRAIVERFQSEGAMVALAGMRLGLFTNEYGALFEESAAQLGAYYLPEITKGILANAKLRSDAFHPNAAGYSLLAERVAEGIKPLLAEAARRRGGSVRG